MLFGVCSSFSVENGAVSIPHLSFLADSGFDYVELPLNAVAALSENDFDSLSGYINASPLPCLCCNCFFPGDIRLTGANFDSGRFEEYLRRAVSRASALGAKKLVLGSAAARNIPSGFPRIEALKQFVARVGDTASVCAEYGILLGVEPLCRSESNLIVSFEESAAVAEELSCHGFDNVKAIFDYYHFAVGNEDLSLLQKYKHCLGHVHFARPLGRVFPCEKDFPELEPVLGAIKASYSGEAFSMECAFPDMESEPAEYARVLSLFKDFFSA